MVQEVKLKLTNLAMAQMLADALRAAADPGADGTLKGAHAALVKNGPAFNRGLLTADITEVAYTGYARQPITWGVPGADSDSRPDVHGASVLFSPTGTAAGDAANAVAIFSDLAAGDLLAYGTLTAPIPFAGPDDDATIVVVVAMPGDEVEDWGTANVVH